MPSPALKPRLRERLQHDAAQGAWYDGPRRYLVLRPDSLMGALRGLDVATRANVFETLAQSLQCHGGDSLRAYAASLGADSGAMIRATVDAAADFGWGRWTIERHDGSLELVVRHSPFAAGWLAAGKTAPGQSSSAASSATSAGTDTPAVCAPILGMFAALAETLGERALQVRETECAAQGHALCRFHAALRGRGAPW